MKRKVVYMIGPSGSGKSSLGNAINEYLSCNGWRSNGHKFKVSANCLVSHTKKCDGITLTRKVDHNVEEIVIVECPGFPDINVEGNNSNSVELVDSVCHSMNRSGVTLILWVIITSQMWDREDIEEFRYLVNKFSLLGNVPLCLAIQCQAESDVDLYRVKEETQLVFNSLEKSKYIIPNLDNRFYFPIDNQTFRNVEISRLVEFLTTNPTTKIQIQSLTQELDLFMNDAQNISCHSFDAMVRTVVGSIRKEEGSLEKVSRTTIRVTSRLLPYLNRIKILISQHIISENDLDSKMVEECLGAMITDSLIETKRKFDDLWSLASHFCNEVRLSEEIDAAALNEPTHAIMDRCHYFLLLLDGWKVGEFHFIIDEDPADFFLRVLKKYVT